MNTQITFGGCDWPIDETCLPDSWDTYSPEIKQRSVSMASAVLSHLTGGRVTNCPITVRPIGSGGVCDSEGMRPLNWAGTWINTSRGRVDPRVCELPGPVGRVDQVKVNGSVLNADHYRIDNGHLLIWQGPGDSPWLRTQNVYARDTEPNTMSVTYLNGYPPDGFAAYAAALMAAEFASACGGKKCRLPGNVTAVVRQGVSYDIISGAFPDGLTGIREIDAFITQWNPKNRRPGIVFDPGAPRHHYTTG